MQTERNTVTKHGCLTIVHHDTHYSRSYNRIRGNTSQTSGEMFIENQNINSELQRPKFDFYQYLFKTNNLHNIRKTLKSHF